MRRMLAYRFIPACAGNGRQSQPRPVRDTVHPRVCGERYGKTPRPDKAIGSSPRVRGTAPRELPRLYSPRFIPACDGHRILFATSHLPVHRVCGERRCKNAPNNYKHGSSPRVRGTAESSDDRICCRRFIPACAGNGCLKRPASGPKSVHPRVCGERNAISRRSRVSRGSSPRVRGTAWRVNRRPVVWRFIPACAGNGVVGSVVVAPNAVHPRVCGERILIPIHNGRAGGSSPRVRGTGPV